MKVDAAVFAALVAVAFAQNLNHVDSTPFHPDETRWLNRGQYIRDVLDPFGDQWGQHYLTEGQPPGGSYLMGLGLLVQGRPLRPNGVWDFNQDEVWNIRHGNMPSQADLSAGRRTSALAGALTVGVVYLLGSILTNRIGGVAGALAFAAHPLAVHLASQALSDAFLALSLASVALAAACFALRPTWLRAILLGGALGWGALVKLSPLPLAFVLAAYGVVAALRPGARRLDRDAGLRLLALPAVAVGAFVVGYPHLWPDPLVRPLRLFVIRAASMQVQGQNVSGVAVSGPIEAVGRAWTHLGEQFTLSGRLADATPGLGWIPPQVDVVVAIAGAAALLAVAVRGGAVAPATLVALTLFGEAGIVLAGLRADYARYYLPLVLVGAVGVGVLAGSAADTIRWTGRGACSRHGSRRRPPSGLDDAATSAHTPAMRG